jgi:hypothetical protein
MGWKYWDVALAVFGFLIQCGLAWLGLTLSHWRNKALFFGLVLVGAVFTGVAVKRGIDSADRVQAQLNTIEQNTEKPQPAPIVNVTPQVNLPQPSQHTRVDFLPPFGHSAFPLLPLHKDEKPTVNLGYLNGGDFATLSGTLGARVAVVPLGVMLGAFRKYRKSAKATNFGGVMNPHTWGGSPQSPHPRAM